MVLPPQRASGFAGLKLVVIMLALGLAVYIVGPPLYWQLAEGVIGSVNDSCTPCLCNCISESDAMLLPDCGKVDPLLKEDLEKSSLELLSEELKLQETMAEESQLHVDSALLDAKKLASQYQKEAEKCNMGMETCEESREKSQAALQAQKKISAMWEKRARELGWRDRSERLSIFSRIGLSDPKADEDSSFFRRKHKL